MNLWAYDKWDYLDVSKLRIMISLEYGEWPGTWSNHKVPSKQEKEVREKDMWEGTWSWAKEHRQLLNSEKASKYFLEPMEGDSCHLSETSD